MAHLDDGALQAYLDDEVAGHDRADAAEHLLGCTECRGRLDALKTANGRLAAALAELDVAHPAGSPRQPLRVRRGLRVGGGSVARAAVLVLIMAAAASASVPGSPVREWIAQVVRPSAPPVEAPLPPPRQIPPPSAARSVPAGLAVPDAHGVEVAVTGLADATIRLVRTETSGVIVSARGGSSDPRFRMEPGRIEVAGGEGGELLVEVPASGGDVRLVVGGRLYAELSEGTLRVLVPGDPEGTGVVWR